MSTWNIYYYRARIKPHVLDSSLIDTLGSEMNNIITSLKNAGVESAKVDLKVISPPAWSTFTRYTEEKIWSLQPANMTDTDISNFVSDYKNALTELMNEKVNEASVEVKRG